MDLSPTRNIDCSSCAYLSELTIVIQVPELWFRLQCGSLDDLLPPLGNSH